MRECDGYTVEALGLSFKLFIVFFIVCTPGHIIGFTLLIYVFKSRVKEQFDSGIATQISLKQLLSLSFELCILLGARMPTNRNTLNQ